MSEQTAGFGTPLPYAREWPATHDLDAARVIVYSFVVLLSVVALAVAVLDLRWGLWTITRVVLYAGSVLSIIVRFVGAGLGLLRVRAGRWITSAGLVSSSAIDILGILLLTLPRIRAQTASAGGGLTMIYYLTYLSHGLWMIAFTAVAIAVLFRRTTIRTESI